MAHEILELAHRDPLYCKELVVSDINPNPCWLHIQIAPSEQTEARAIQWNIKTLGFCCPTSGLPP